jgi:tripartite-type tricarboxylate transporter receptor subunit TctC
MKSSHVLLMALAVFAMSQTEAEPVSKYPSHAIKILVPYAPGGVGDVVSRVIGDSVAQSLGQAVVVESRPGGNSNIATLAVLRAPADGYTWLMASPSLSANPSLYSGIWDTAKDFTGVGIVATAPNLVTVPASSKANNLQEFVALAKQSAGKLSYGNPAIGSSMHLNTELFKLSAGIDLVSVPYKGQPPTIVDLIRGDLAVVFLSPGLAVPQIIAGKLKALAVVGQHRIANLPNVPTMAEAGYPEANAVPHYGLVVSSKTPKDIAQKINAAISRALQEPGVQEKLKFVGLDPEPPRDLDQAQAVLKSDVLKYKDIIQRAGIKSD